MYWDVRWDEGNIERTREAIPYGGPVGRWRGDGHAKKCVHGIKIETQIRCRCRLVTGVFGVVGVLVPSGAIWCL